MNKKPVLVTVPGANARVICQEFQVCASGDLGIVFTAMFAINNFASFWDIDVRPSVQQLVWDARGDG